VLGLATPTAGQVLVDGVPLVDLDVLAWRRAIAFLPQRPYLAPRATVRECLRFLEGDVSEEWMHECLERVGLRTVLGRASQDPLGVRVGTLSIGQRQRVALARVLCRRAPMVVLDEPDANLDRDGIELVGELVSEIARDRMVLVVAHTQELLARADRVVTLDAGRVRSNAASEKRIARVARIP
jgi:ABC-type transport system involved in cytochrome bd biosynthesis fused ATPase/permease subunit